MKALERHGLSVNGARARRLSYQIALNTSYHCSGGFTFKDLDNALTKLEHVGVTKLTYRSVPTTSKSRKALRNCSARLITYLPRIRPSRRTISNRTSPIWGTTIGIYNLTTCRNPFSLAPCFGSGLFCLLGPCIYLSLHCG